MDNAGASITPEEAALLVARVRALVRACPPGRVTTYGWIGTALGLLKGGGARVVGWIMNEAGGGISAQRVINSKGELSGSWAFGKRGTMRELLEGEGIEFTPKGTVDLKRYGWDPSRDLSEEQRTAIITQATPEPDLVTDRLMYLLRADPASPFRAGRSSPANPLPDAGMGS